MKTCKFCKGSGFENVEEMKNLRIYGYSLQEIANILDYAFQYGYKTGEMKQLNEVVVPS